MIKLHLCQHQLELLTRAVTAYQPDADEDAITRSSWRIWRREPKRVPQSS